jgi:hypothetical protein
MKKELPANRYIRDDLVLTHAATQGKCVSDGRSLHMEVESDYIINTQFGITEFYV